ncbi:class II fructose-bisphosphate aldolase, partial [Hungatella hathewayi]
VEFTNPGAAKRFVALTGCDSLAVSAGTSHGGVKAAENLPLHMEVLERIQAELPGFPLVLHGAASLPMHLIEAVNEQGGRVEVMKNCSESSIRRSAEYGVCKANMDVDNFLAFTGAVRRVLNEQPDKYDPRVYLKQGKNAWKKEVMWKMSQVTGSSGHNWVKEGVRQ